MKLYTLLSYISFSKFLEESYENHLQTAKSYFLQSKSHDIHVETGLRRDCIAVLAIQTDKKKITDPAVDSEQSST